MLSGYMYQSTPATAADIANCRTVARFLGQQFRDEQALDHSVTVKMHLLEAHMPDQLEEFGSLGRFSEEIIEQEHHTYNLLNVRYGRETDWTTRQASIVSYLRGGNQPSTLNYIAQVQSSSKRKFSPEVEERRARRVGENKENGQERSSNTMLVINTLLET